MPSAREMRLFPRFFNVILGAGPWAVSSAVEHCFHTAGVTGSIPVPPTTHRERQRTRESSRENAAKIRHAAKAHLFAFVHSPTV